MNTEQYTSSFKKGVLGVLLVILAVLVVPQFASASEVFTETRQLGSGTPGPDTVDASKWVSTGPDGEIYHSPQYMPGFPTAATIWPRVVDVECIEADDLSTNDPSKERVLVCDGYAWQPKFGRGEYLFFRPRMKEKPVPVECCKPQPPVIILKEVPVKAGKQ